MKKKLLLVTAAAMMLVACNGNNANSDYVAEPEVKQELKKEDASKKLTSVSTNLATIKAIGADLAADFSLDYSMKTTANSEYGIPASETAIALSAKDVKASLAMNGLASKDFAASASYSTKVAGSVKADVPTYDFDSEGNMVASTQKVDAKLDETAINNKAFIEGGYSYVDIDSSLQKIVDFAAKVSGTTDGLTDVDFSEITGKIKTPISTEALTQLSSFNVALSTFLGQFAVTIGTDSIKDLIPAAGSGSDSFSDYFSFKEYKDGTFGITCDIDISKLLSSLIPSTDEEGEEGESAIASLLSMLKGNFKAAVNFSEKELLSFGAKFDLSAKTGSAELGATLGLALKGGFKVTLAYGDKVNVEKVTDKDSYKEVRLDNGDLEDGDLEDED